MNNKNTDFDDLADVYLESKQNKTTPDNTPDEELIQEGLYDRIKARAEGLKDAAGSYTSGVKSALMGKTGEIEDSKGKYKQTKIQSIVNSHVNKIDASLSEFATDLVKLGVIDDEQAESIASKASRIIKANPNVANILKNA